MRILVIADDIWHPVEVIRRGLEAFPDGDVSFAIVCTAKDILTPEMLAAYPIVMICKGDCINAANSAPWFEEGVTEVGPQELREYVEAGGNLLVIHAGCDVNPEWLPQEEKFRAPCRAYIALIGCHFVSHPLRCAVTVRPVVSHPLTDGVCAFTCRDEQYVVEVTAADAEPLLETESESGGRQIGGYLRPVGKGKIVLYTPGHTLSVWQDANWQRLLRNTIRYLARE